MRRLTLFLGFIMLFSGPLSTSVSAAAGSTVSGAGCQFILGFKEIHDAIPSVVGDCIQNEDDTSGDHFQQTTNGTLVWRKADNWAAFTDGQQTWVKGPFGVQQRPNTSRFPWEVSRDQPVVDPATATPNKGVFISVGQELLVAYEDGSVVVRTPVTTGGPYTPTPVGTFSVIEKRSKFIMKSPWPEPDPRWYPDSYVNFGILYERTGYFVHDAPWRDAYGPGTNLFFNPYLGWTGTHGCVNVPFDAEAKLFSWASIGTPVFVVP